MIAATKVGNATVSPFITEPALPPFNLSVESCLPSFFSVPKSLGPIWKVQVWHDNSGSSPSWFLSRILVKDMSTQKCATFVVDKWFAVEEDDGKVEREILAADAPLPANVVFKAKGKISEKVSLNLRRNTYFTSLGARFCSM